MLRLVKRDPSVLSASLFGWRLQLSENRGTDMSSDHEAAAATTGASRGSKPNPYGELRPKNPLLANTNHGAAYFDSADWELRSGTKTGGTPSQLRPAYPTAKQGGSPRKMPGRAPSNLGGGGKRPEDK